MSYPRWQLERPVLTVGRLQQLLLGFPADLPLYSGNDPRYGPSELTEVVHVGGNAEWVMVITRPAQLTTDQPARGAGEEGEG